MGFGDDIMATGLAKGAALRGKQIAFGNEQKIIWGPWSKQIFKNNPNIAEPGRERSKNVEWIHYYKGHRIYNKLAADRWLWNMEFRAKPGEVYFDASDPINCPISSGFILIEPNVPQQKTVAKNKQWPFERYQAVVDEFMRQGFDVAQFDTGPHLKNVRVLKTQSFRHAMALMTHAKLAILPEGGLHHAAAALGVPAVVIFGGFIPPSVTGYERHTNLTGGTKVFCGSLRTCAHCREAMDRITIDDVLDAAGNYL